MKHPFVERETRWILRTKRHVYRFDRRIFGAIFLFILLWVGAAMWESGFTREELVLKCNSLQPCLNPYLDELGFCTAKNPAWCEPRVIQPGETVGNEPGFFAGSAGAFATLLTLLGLTVNHAVHNNEVKIL